MQAFVLLHQTMREHEWSSRLMLNGATVRLGSAAEVIDQVYGRRSCGVALLDGRAWFEWEFEGERDEMSMAVRRTRGETPAGSGWEVDGSQPLHYLLPAAANGLLIDRTAAQAHVSDRRKTWTARILSVRRSSADACGRPERGNTRPAFSIPVVTTACCPGLVSSGVPPTRFRQVEARMGRFFPGCVLAIGQIPRANAVTLGIRASSDTDFHRPVHAGFGLTQVLPIVVAALSANDGDLLLIENPEVHLHPAGQAAVGEFLAEIASAGVQVLIETHSDHVLNGVRRAVKGGMLTSDHVALHFFRPRRGTGDGWKVPGGKPGDGRQRQYRQLARGLLRSIRQGHE